MRYIINDIIEFNPNERFLKNIKTNDKIKLYYPASIILLNLISTPSQTFTYGELIALAWRGKDKSVSISTLHQNILNVRSALRKLGLEKNIIISIPKEGFRLCSQTTISDKIPFLTEKKNKRSMSRYKSIAFAGLLIVCASFFFIKAATNYNLIAFEQHYFDTGLVSGNCKLYVNTDAPVSDIKKSVISGINLNCTERMDAYITIYQKDSYSIFQCKNRLPLGISKVCVNEIVNN